MCRPAPKDGETFVAFVGYMMLIVAMRAVVAWLTGRATRCCSTQQMVVFGIFWKVVRTAYWKTKRARLSGADGRLICGPRTRKAVGPLVPGKSKVCVKSIHAFIIGCVDVTLSFVHFPRRILQTPRSEVCMQHNSDAVPLLGQLRPDH